MLLPEPFVAAGVQSIATLCTLPASTLRDELIARAVAGELVIGSAWQEQGGEIDAPSPATTSATDGKRDTLNGAKEWVVPGAGADGWLVTATSSAGIAVHWVPSDTPGAKCEAVPRVDGSTMGRLALRNVSVPVSHCLARGDAAQRGLGHGNDVARLMQAAELLGVARRRST